MKFNLATFVLGSCATFAAAQEENSTTTTSMSILDVAMATDDLSTLVVAVETAELTDALADPAVTLTVFAPTDTALAGIDPKFLTAPWKTHLTNILLTHVLDMEVMSDAVTDGVMLTALSKENFTATVNETGVFLGSDLFSSQVTTADVDASNGVVHIVNAFFMPSWTALTLADIAANVKGFDSVARFITEGGLEDEIAAENRTIFAPNADAFATVPADLTAQIVNDESLIAVILKHHIVEGVWSKASLTDGLELTTLDGNILVISMMDDMIMIDTAAVNETDFLAMNGVSHVITTVLLPPSLMPEGEETVAPAVPGSAPVDTPVAEGAPAAPVAAPTSSVGAFMGSASALLASVVAMLL